MNKYRDGKLNPMILMVILMVAMRFMRGGISDPLEWFIDKLLLLPGIIIGLSLHEFGHAIVSTKLGDPTPKAQGRVTLNPLAHIDPMGMLALFFAGFGWGVPVQINPSYYKHRRRDEALVAVAGVTMNLVIVVLTTIILRFIVHLAPYGFLLGTTGGVILEILENIIVINIVLMFFNLLPVPPLDGFNIITQIFNLSKYQWYGPLYRNGFMILILLIVFNITGFILNPLVSGVFKICYSFIVG